MFGNKPNKNTNKTQMKTFLVNSQILVYQISTSFQRIKSDSHHSKVTEISFQHTRAFIVTHPHTYCSLQHNSTGRYINGNYKHTGITTMLTKHFLRTFYDPTWSSSLLTEITLSVTLSKE